MTAQTPTQTNKRQLGVISAVFVSFLMFALPASATPGDRAVYTVGTTGSTILAVLTVRAYSTFPRTLTTTTVAPLFGTYSVDGSGKIFVGQGTHVLIHNSEWDSNLNATYDDRGSIHSYVKLNGSEIPYGSASGYFRDNNDDELFIIGGTILDIDGTTDYIELETIRVDVHDTNTAESSMQEVTTSAQLVKLDEANLSFARLSISTDTEILAPNQEGTTDATKNVNYNVQDEVGSAFTHSTTTNSDQITFNETGKYLVFANSGFFINNQQGQRQMVTQQLELNGTAIAGGATTVYMRNSGNGDNSGGAMRNGSTSIGVVIDATANDVLTVRILRDNVNSTARINLESTRTGLAIAKLPDYGNYISLTGSAQETDPGNPLLYSGSNVTNAAFKYEVANPSDVEIQKDGDYLFFSSQYGAAQANGQRSTIQHEFAVGGTSITYGYGGTYNRAEDIAGATNDRVINSGTWAGIIASSTTAFDVVDTASLTRAGGSGTISAVPALQGIDIASISSVPVDPVIVANNALVAFEGSIGNTITTALLQTVDTNTTDTTTIEYTLDVAPTEGTLKLSGTPLVALDTWTQADIDNGLLTYDQDIIGPFPPDVFDFTVTDTANGGETDPSSTFTINIGVATVLVADVFGTFEDSTIDDFTEAVLLDDNDIGTDLDALDVTGGTTALGGTFDIISNGAGGGVGWTYIASGGTINALAEGELVVDTFPYSVVDFASQISTTTVTINLTGKNDAPITVGEDLTILNNNTGLTADILANDLDIDNGAVLSIGTFDDSTALSGTKTITTANGGILTIDTSGNLTFDISQTTTYFDIVDGGTIVETFNYTVIDELGLAGPTVAVNITVSGAPGASNDYAQVDADGTGSGTAPPITIDVLANDTAVNGAIGTATLLPVIEFDAANTLNTATEWYNSGTSSGDQPVIDAGGSANDEIVGAPTLDTTVANAPPGVTAVYNFSGGAAASNDSGVRFEDIGNDGTGAPLPPPTSTSATPRSRVSAVPPTKPVRKFSSKPGAPRTDPGSSSSTTRSSSS